MKNLKDKKKFIKIVKKAEKEIYQFELNEAEYGIDDLIEYGLGEKVPNLIELSKKCKNVKILNIGGSPILFYKKTTN